MAKGTKGECFNLKINELYVMVGGFFKEYVERQKSGILEVKAFEGELFVNYHDQRLSTF